jgi:DNA-binding NarL/FixJ family response regulator
MPQSRRSWSVLVVDDSAEFRHAVCDWMATRPEFDVIGMAADGAEAIRRVDGLGPQLVVMDAMMPVLDGFHATRTLKERADCPRIVIVSFHDSEIVRQEAWAAGADGFAPKADLTRSLPGIIGGLDGAVGDAGPDLGSSPDRVRRNDETPEGP